MKNPVALIEHLRAQRSPGGDRGCTTYRAGSSMWTSDQPVRVATGSNDAAFPAAALAGAAVV